MSSSGFIILDKPQGITSQGAVSRVKRILNERRVGHGGTLDPMATGVLPVFVGRATRASELMLDADKAYTAHFISGFATDTRDTTGATIAESGRTASPDDVLAVLPQFMGRQSQMPPMYSAVKIEGKKLYELARKGIEVERQPREIEIKELAYRGFADGQHCIDVTCSKGTYIRELIHDIGVALGTYAAMSQLRRTRTGRFTIDEAVAIEALTPDALRPTDELFIGLPFVTVDGDGERKIRVGAPAVYAAAPQVDMLRVYAESGDFLCIAKPENGLLVTVKSFFEV